MTKYYFPIVKIQDYVSLKDFKIVKSYFCTRFEAQEIATNLHENEWVISGIGSALLINNSKLVLTQRSADAPSNPLRWTINSGLIDRENELNDPISLYREGIEETLFKYQNKILVPRFESEELNFIVSDIYANIKIKFQHLEFSSDTFNAETIDLSDLTNIQI